jgi:hypothetical protein
MNVIREIMRLLRCDEATAYAVRDGMDSMGLDYSECSVREFNRACWSAYDTLQCVRSDMEKAS